VVGDRFYVILAGQARVVVNGRTVHHLLPGDHFGEISLLDGQERTASVVTETPTTLLEVTQKDFFRLLVENPDIAIAILEGMARAVRRIDRSLAQ
jgi:CRP-like cAMP-binding protein